MAFPARRFALAFSALTMTTAAHATTTPGSPPSASANMLSAKEQCVADVYAGEFGTGAIHYTRSEVEEIPSTVILLDKTGERIVPRGNSDPKRQAAVVFTNDAGDTEFRFSRLVQNHLDVAITQKPNGTAPTFSYMITEQDPATRQRAQTRNYGFLESHAPPFTYATIVREEEGASTRGAAFMALSDPKNPGMDADVTQFFISAKKDGKTIEPGRRVPARKFHNALERCKLGN